MTIEQLRKLYSTRPFQAFVMHLADGRQIPVLHAEFMATSPSGRTVTVFQPDDTMDIIDLLLVTSLQIKPSASGKRHKN